MNLKKSLACKAPAVGLLCALVSVTAVTVIARAVITPVVFATKVTA